MREFSTGATRDTDDGKPEYAKFLSPTALRAFASYMHKHRVQSDGGLRAGDNWKKGMPKDVYMESMFRHFMDVWSIHATGDAPSGVTLEEALCAMMFNVQGMLHEVLKDGEPDKDISRAMTERAKQRYGVALDKLADMLGSVVGNDSRLARSRATYRHVRL